MIIRGGAPYCNRRSGVYSSPLYSNPLLQFALFATVVGTVAWAGIIVTLYYGYLLQFALFYRRTFSRFDLFRRHTFSRFALL